jgi:hypothetical protein
MKPHCGKNEVGKTVSQVEDFFIGCQVCPNSNNALDPSVLGSFQGSLEVWDLIQMSMGIDESE